MAGQQSIVAVVAADASPFKKAMADAGKSTSILTGSLKNVAAVGAAAFAGLTVAGAAFAIQAMKAADESRQISRGLETAVKNSKAFGNNAVYIKGVTDALDEQSRKLGELTGIDDEVISGIKRNWLSVGQIAGSGIGGINKLAAVAADVAAGTGKELDAVATAFTKAYGDPKGAIPKLQKAGVMLTQQEKDRYQLLLDTKTETEALAYLTDTMATKFAGSAEAAASPFQRLQVTIGNLQESIGGLLLPIIDGMLPDLQKAFSDLAVDPEFIQSIQDFSATIQEVLPKIMDDMPTIIQMFKDLAGVIGGMTDAVTTIYGLFTGDTSVLPKFSSFMNDAWHNITFGLLPSQQQLNQQKLTQTNPSTTVNIKVNAVSSSVETGRAIASALGNFYSMNGYPGLRGRYNY
jgi:hypothetical protein